MTEFLRENVTGAAADTGGLVVVGGGGLVRASVGPLPDTRTDASEDENLTRLFAIWTADTPDIGSITVGWQFGKYGGVFRPTADDREIGTSEARFVYGYDPNPNGPFREGNFRDKQWEAWTITAPSPDVTTAEIAVLSEPTSIIMLGAAITRNGVMVCTNGPKPDSAHCLFDFTQ
jgi:hypothetical protein